MSLLRSSCCVLALTLLILVAKVSCNGIDIVVDAAELEYESEKRVKRQQVFFSFGFTSDTQQRVTLVVQRESTSIIANDPNLQIVDISMSQSVSYNGSTVFVSNETETMYSNINTFTFLNTMGNVIKYDPGNPSPEISGPGTLFVQGTSAFYSTVANLNAQIRSAIPTLPPIIMPFQQIEVEVVERDSAGVMQLALNIDSPPDGTYELGDDVLQLTGSMALTLSGRESVLYTGNNILITSGGSTITNRFNDVVTFSTLRPAQRGPFSGQEFRQFNRRVAGPIQGPGILRTGTQGGQNVAFFSSIGTVNQRIANQLVGMQLEFRATSTTAEILARFPSVLNGQRLVMLNGAQSFSYPDATSIRTTGNMVSVFAGSRLLQRFDTGSTPTFSTFLNHQVTRRMMAAPMTFAIPDGGATLLFNMQDNEFFVYPSRNSIIGQAVNQARETAGITEQVVMTADYSFAINDRGIATLLAKFVDENNRIVEQEVVQVAPGATIINLGSQNFISYQGNTIEILDGNGNVVQTISNISPLTINAQGTEYLSSTDNFTTAFSGPGRLYIDPSPIDMPAGSTRRAFYTANPSFQSAITNFVNSLPEPIINVVRNNTSGVISFQTGMMNLFDLNGASTVTAPSGTTGIYSNNQISFVRSFDVPNNARAMYSATDGRLRVRDPANPGRNLFDIPITMILREFVDPGTVGSIDLTSDYTFNFMNGLIYFSDRGALVASTDTINDGIYRLLTNMGDLEASVGNPITGVMRLTVADGRSIITYQGSAPTRLPSGGMYYVSSDGNSSMFISNTRFNSRFPGIYSQLNPTTTTYNRTTGVVSVISPEGGIISTLRPGITETQTIGQFGSIYYVNETIFFQPEIRSPVRMINRLVVWNGFMMIEYNRGNDDITFEGPGIFWFEGDTAFFTSDPVTVNRVNQRITSVIGTFRRPIISSMPRSFRSKNRTVLGGFPQTITVYEGADVMLFCSVLAGSPPPMILFQRRIFNTTTNQFEYETIMDGDSPNVNVTISARGNNATLTIRDIRADGANTINGTGEFRCVASNVRGQVTQSTTVEVLPPQPPAIVSGFIPPLSYLNNRRERLIPIRAGDSNNMLTVDYRRIITRGTSPIQVNDPATIVDTIHIGCKAEGLPKADIVWYQLNQTGDGSPDLTDMMRVRLIDMDGDNINITEPRQGRSVLSVTFTFDPNDIRCRKYICEASNLATPPGQEALGAVDICPQFYVCESGSIEETGTCSATCGLGLISRRYGTCTLSFNGAATPVDYEQVPFGLYPLAPTLCRGDLDRCPQISYQFGVESETECSVTCSVGSIMRTIVCQQIVDGMVNGSVEDSFCAGQYRPSSFVTCANNPPCPFWQAGEYGACSATCGSDGIRTRPVSCVQPRFDNATFELILDMNNRTVLMTVDDEFCANGSIGRPLPSLSCNDHIDCPIRWRPEPWGPCNTSLTFSTSTVGSMRGCQEREIICEEYNIDDYYWPGTRINDSVCESLGLPRPHSVRSCHGLVCNFGVWRTDRSQCSVTCGKGLLFQNATCVDRATGAEIEEGYCAASLRPDRVVPCPSPPQMNCPGVCDFEPPYCPVIKALGCGQFRSLALNCCNSCRKIPPTVPIATVTAAP